MAGASGFRPSTIPNSQWMRNLAAQASTNRPIAVGDAVAMVNGIAVPCTSGQDPSQRGFGVVMSIYTTAGRPLTFQSNKIIVSGQVGRVDVCYDPNQRYYVRCITSCGPSNIGKNATLDDTTSLANATTGISGQSVNIPASASQNDLFKIVGLGQFDELGGKDTGGGANNGVEVVWNFHAFKATVAGQ